jgi:hypothetical protein
MSYAHRSVAIVLLLGGVALSDGTRDPTARGADGRGKLDVGLHADSACPQESRAPGRTIDGRADLEGPRSATSADAPDLRRRCGRGEAS